MITTNAMCKVGIVCAAYSALMLSTGFSLAQSPAMIPAPDRSASDGVGPFKKMVIRGATLIDGTGGPPRGPVDIIIEENRITDIVNAGTPGLPLKEKRNPTDTEHEIDATGMFVTPGFVDVHAHGGDPKKAPELEYPYKLWLAHGVTTVRGVALAWGPLGAAEKLRSEKNEITAPRIFNYQTLGSAWDKGRVTSPDLAREWVKWAAANNIDGIKFFNRGDETPEIIAAAIDEAKKNKLGTVAHLSQNLALEVNAESAAAMGLGTVTHFYGHFESLLKDHKIQNFPADYNYNNEYDRFAGVADIWNQIYEPDSPEWKAYLQKQKNLGIVFDPTFTIYAASRDLMRARNADWHDKYTIPSLWKFFQSTRDNHGSYFYDWTTHDEVQWRNFYQRYMHLVNDYKKMGGRVTTGSDSGFIYKLYGFGYIEELELLQEAGFSPLEVIQSATINGARTLMEPKGEAPQFGIVRKGMLADLVIMPENPLANFKTLYGTGHERLNPATNEPEIVGGVKWTIKDGIVFDAKKLLNDVADMVAAKKAETTK